MTQEKSKTKEEMKEIVQREQLEQLELFSQLRQIQNNLSYAIETEDTQTIQQVLNIMADLNHRLTISRSFTHGIFAVTGR